MDNTTPTRKQLIEAARLEKLHGPAQYVKTKDREDAFFRKLMPQAKKP